MPCPKCSSNFLMIRQQTGFERIALLFTELRKYMCQDCGHVFRAPDRRRFKREGDSLAACLAPRTGR
jgi:hypothetical protein